MRRFILLLSLTAALGGCGNGWPWGRGPDPNAATAVQQAEPLIAECRQHFIEALHGMKVSWQSGPTVVRDGASTIVQLEAQPESPDVLHAPRYDCNFDGSALVSHGLE